MVHKEQELLNILQIGVMSSFGDILDFFPKLRIPKIKFICKEYSINKL